jgi:aquaporin Z
MLEYVVEFFGTFLFLSVILATGSPVLIALALLAVILMGGPISGGHFNPAVSVMMWAKGDVSLMTALSYIGLQCAGGLAALGTYKMFLKEMVSGFF